MKKIAIFNHKGGVSKTTTSFNLGWSISKLGKRVLLVDADSQCNLTMYSLGKEKFEEYIRKITRIIFTLLYYLHLDLSQNLLHQLIVYR